MLINKKDYKLAVEYLNNDEVISLPTETVMGLAVKASSFSAYNKLIEVKNRPMNKAFPFIVGNKKDIEKYAYVDEVEKQWYRIAEENPELAEAVKEYNNAKSQYTSKKKSTPLYNIGYEYNSPLGKLLH